MCIAILSMAAAIFLETRDLMRFKEFLKMVASWSVHENNLVIGILVHNERLNKMLIYQFVLIN